MKKMEKNNNPIQRYKAGVISLSIFKNSREINDKVVDFHSYQLQRRYKDKNGEWQNTTSMSVNDLPKAGLLLRKAYEEATLKKDHIKSEVAGAVVRERAPAQKG